MVYEWFLRRFTYAWNAVSVSSCEGFSIWCFSTIAGLKIYNWIAYSNRDINNKLCTLLVLSLFIILATVNIVIMPWSEAQRQRLAAEKSVLDHYFPGCVKWIDPTGGTKVEVELKTNNDNCYTLRIYIGDFPNSVPDMVVVSSPRPMPNWSVLQIILGENAMVIYKFVITIAVIGLIVLRCMKS